MRESLSSLASHTRFAVPVGVIGGFLLGAREGVLTLHANAFVQPAQYFFPYLTIPILMWVVLGLGLVLFSTAIHTMTRRNAKPSQVLRINTALLALTEGKPPMNASKA